MKLRVDLFWVISFFASIQSQLINNNNVNQNIFQRDQHRITFPSNDVETGSPAIDSQQQQFPQAGNTDLQAFIFQGASPFGSQFGPQAPNDFQNNGGPNTDLAPQNPIIGTDEANSPPIILEIPATADANPHAPEEEHYKNFEVVFRDFVRKAEPETFNATIEAADIEDDFNGRSIVAPGQYPHMSALGFRTSSGEIDFKCGGSLISEWFVLTAAHCCYVNGQTPSIVKIGDIKLKEREQETRPQRRRIVGIFVHPLYNSSLYYHDIGILQLSRPIEYTRYVRPIRLWAHHEIPYGMAYSMGYGSTSFAKLQTNILTELDLSIVPLDRCNSAMPRDKSAPEGIVESQICAQDFVKNRDTCQGDSGGPLQLNLERRRRKRLRYYLVGITSYGAACRSSYPGIYTRVSSYIDWIAPIVWPNYF